MREGSRRAAFVHGKAYLALDLHQLGDFEPYVYVWPRLITCRSRNPSRIPRYESTKGDEVTG